MAWGDRVSGMHRTIDDGPASSVGVGRCRCYFLDIYASAFESDSRPRLGAVCLCALSHGTRRTDGPHSLTQVHRDHTRHTRRARAVCPRWRLRCAVWGRHAFVRRRARRPSHVSSPARTALYTCPVSCNHRALLLIYLFHAYSTSTCNFRTFIRALRALHSQEHPTQNIRATMPHTVI